MKKYLIVLVMILISISFAVKAQGGCIASNIPFQINETMYQSYNPNGYFDLYGARDTNPYATYCVTVTGNSCVVKGLASYQGKEVTFQPLPCPLDMEINLFLLAIALFALYRIKLMPVHLTQ